MSMAKKTRKAAKAAKAAKNWQKKIKLFTAAASVLVVVINMWQDHKEAVFRNK